MAERALLSRYYLRRLKQQPLLLVETTAWLLLLPLLLRLIPFRRLAPHLGQPEGQPVIALSPTQQREAMQVSQALTRSKRTLPWPSSCLTLACAGAMMLRRRQIPYTLYLGARVHRERLEAHAWLRSGSVTVTGGDGESAYAVVAAFAC